MLRTHDAGTLRASDAGSTVTLAGWVARRRDHGGVVFLDLRDASGYVQVVVREEEAHALRNEFCVLVTGEVRRRPEGNENPELPTGEIEVATVGAAGARPRRRRCPSRSRPTRPRRDDVRYRYRYLDLRRQGPARALRLRSEVNRIARERHGRARVRRGGDAEPDPLDARGRARLRRPRPAAAGQVVRAAAVAAAVQAAADDRRAGALLPDRALLPGRGLPRRPAAGVHPAGLRDELRRARRRARRRRGRRPRAVAGAGRLRGAARSRG